MSDEQNDCWFYVLIANDEIDSSSISGAMITLPCSLSTPSFYLFFNQQYLCECNYNPLTKVNKMKAVIGRDTRVRIDD